ncbi:SPFH domain-containing protein, partial [Arthrospira platensis SPKY1]|nr:SPFH domain-containing protein [Arthrospira platensis SPKY1]
LAIAGTAWLAVMAEAKWALVVVLLVAVLGMVGFATLRRLVLVDELQTAVVRNHLHRGQARYLPPGHHWLKPLEYVKATLPTRGWDVRGSCQQLLTGDGLPVNVQWQLLAELAPERIAPELRIWLAETLPQNGVSLLRQLGNNQVHYLVNECTLPDLTAPGARRRLEGNLRQALAEELAPYGFLVHKMMLTAVELPHAVQHNLEQAHARQTYALSEAAALQALNGMLKNLDERNLAWLLHLKQLHALEQNGIALPFAPDVYTSILESASAARRRARWGGARDGRAARS